MNYDLYLTELCTAHAKQTEAVMTVNDVCSFLTVYTLSDLVLHPRVHLLLILNKFIMKSFLV